MSLEGRDLNDSQILGGTVQETDDGGKVRYKTTLPSGRPLVSEWMRPDDMQGKTVISWCDHVRQQVEVDAAEEKALKKREGEPTILEEEPTEEDRGTVPEAMQFALDNRDKWSACAAAAEEEVDRWKTKRKKARAEYENWEKIVDSLRGENDE